MLPSDAQARKEIPIYSGFVRYFPNAMAAVAQLSFLANEQHNPGEEMHWAKEKSTDELDAEMRHLVDHAEALNEGNDETLLRDSEGVLHATKNAWRAMANLERMYESGIDIFAKQLDNTFQFNGETQTIDLPVPEFAGIDFGESPARSRIEGLVPPTPDSNIQVAIDTFLMCTGLGPDNGERDKIIVVAFADEDFVAIEGPFANIEAAEDWARRNPDNRAGVKSVHTI